MGERGRDGEAFGLDDGGSGLNFQLLFLQQDYFNSPPCTPSSFTATSISLSWNCHFCSYLLCPIDHLPDRAECSVVEVVGFAVV